MIKFEIDTVVFCEAIRAELAGKFALLGACAPDLTIAAMPNVIPCALFVIGVPSIAGPFKLEFRYLAPDETATHLATLEGVFQGRVTTSIPLSTFPVNLTDEGNYVFEWKFEGGSWKKIGTLRIRLLNSLN